MKMFALGASLVATLIATDASADSVQLTEKPDHVTEGRTVIDAPPDQVYALVTSYASWQSFLSDVSDVRVEQGGRDRARVRFKSRAIGYTVVLELANAPGRAISFRGIKGPPGGRAHGEYLFQPVDNGKRTSVVATLYLDVKGAAGLFVRDSEIRDKRRAKLRADLEDVARYFANRRQAAGARP